MKAGEMVKMLQEEYPHIPMRLGTAEDPEASSVLINFYPEPMRPKKSKPPERSDSSLEPGNEQPQTNKPKEVGR
jgi:hypothetical protein